MNLLIVLMIGVCCFSSPCFSQSSDSLKISEQHHNASLAQALPSHDESYILQDSFFIQDEFSIQTDQKKPKQENLSILNPAPIQAQQPSDSGKRSVVSTPYDKLTKKQKRMLLVFPSLSHKRKSVYIGGALIAGGLFLNYAFLQPINNSLDANEMGERFALLNPTLLALGLKFVGTLMVGTQSTQAIQTYVTFVGTQYPKNYTWWIYGTGVGLAATSQILNIQGTFASDERLIRAATIITIVSDMCWIATSVYALTYFNTLETKAQNALSGKSISVLPIIGIQRNGLAVSIRF